MSGSALSVNSTSIFVDDRGAGADPPLLYVHGGPGYSCWDFMARAAEPIVARGVRVIGVDQRGVLRSDPLPEDPPLTPELLISDYEALRQQLGIDRWTVLGHSAGGPIALDYALAHPAAVSGLIMDCPSLDADATDRYRLPRAAKLLDAIGKSEAAVACRRYAEQPERLTGADETWKAMLELEDGYFRLFVHDEDGLQRYTALMETAPDDFDWDRGASHQPLIAHMYRDRMPSLAELAVPSALIHGIDDLVTPPEMVAQYREATGGITHAFPRSGHFAYVEETADYATVVADLVRRFAPARG